MMKIIWLPLAVQQRKRASAYGRRVFGKAAAKRFLEKVLHLNDLLADNPRLGAVEEQLSGGVHKLPSYVYRSIVVTHNYKLIYRIDEPANSLYVVALWDCRTNPVRLYDEVGGDWPLSMVNEERVPYGKKQDK